LFLPQLVLIFQIGIQPQALQLQLLIDGGSGVAKRGAALQRSTAVV
jgi:hypothetical protein